MAKRWALLAVAGATALIGLTAVPGLGASAPPGGAVLTRRYDPASATTTFTVDVARGSGTALSLVTCPGARVLEVEGPGTSETVETAGGTTILFPSGDPGTYRVILAGDSPGMGVGEEPSGCPEATLVVDPAVLERAGVELGPSTRISNP